VRIDLGVAETEGKEGEDVQVVRTGVASGLSDLQTGFQYYGEYYFYTCCV
jgi:hypothetical protein